MDLIEEIKEQPEPVPCTARCLVSAAHTPVQLVVQCQRPLGHEEVPNPLGGTPVIDHYAEIDSRVIRWTRTS